MDNIDKMAGRGGGFIMRTGDDTSTMQNVIGSEAGFWAFAALKAGSTFSTIEDGGADAFSNGTAGTNYGINVPNTYEFPVNVILPASSMRGFTKLVCSSGEFIVYRMKSASNIEPNMD